MTNEKRLFSVYYSYLVEDNIFEKDSFVVEGTEEEVSAYCDKKNLAAKYLTGQDAPFDYNYVEISPSTLDEGEEPALVAYVYEGRNYPSIRISSERLEAGAPASVSNQEPFYLDDREPRLQARFVIVPEKDEPKKDLLKRAQAIGEKMIAEYKEAHGE